MIKKSSKVLSMVMAFSMAASVFVAPNAFADFNAKDPITAKVKTVFLEKNANGVYEESDANVATVEYSDGTTDIEDPDDFDDDLGKFKIGETYNVTIKQSNAQATAHTINSAKIGVDLTIGDEYYDEYLEDITLISSTDSDGAVTYAGSFTAFGVANVALDNDNNVSCMYVYIDFETKESTVTASAGTVNYATIVPLDSKNNEVDSVTLKAGEDAYFKVKLRDGYYVENAPEAYAYTKNSSTAVDSDDNGIELALSTDEDKGLNVYKLEADDVDTLIGLAGANGTVKVNFTASSATNSYSVSLSDSLKSKYTITYSDGSAVGNNTVYPDTELKVVSNDSTVISNITFDVNDVQVYYSNSKTAEFVMPGEDLQIKDINSYTAASTSTFSLGNDYAAWITINDNLTKVTAKQGSTQKLVFTTGNSRNYPDILNPYMYDVDYDNDGWNFEFLGVKDGSLVYNVTFGSKDLEAKTAKLALPSKTDKFTPAIKFDQMISADKAYVRLAELGTNGVVTLKETTPVKVEYIYQSIVMDYISLAGTTKKSSAFSSNKDNDDDVGVAEAYFTITADNKKNLLLDIDADYKLGNIDVESDNGTLIATNNLSTQKSISREKAGNTVYLVATPKAGYKLNSIAIANASTGKAITVNSTANANIKYFVMPSTNVNKTNNYGDSVVVTATFVKDSSIVLVNNLVPEADKANNNGYAEASFGTATQITAGKEFTVEYVANDNCKLLSTSIQYKNAKNETVTLKATSVDGNKYTYTAPTDANGTMSISAKFAKTSDIIKVENKTAEADKKTNNGYVTVDASEVVAGDTINGTVTAVEGYKVTGVSYSYTNSDKKTVTNDVTVKENAFSITVPKDVIANGAISIEAKFEKSSEEAKKDAWVKDGDNWTYWKDGKQVTGWFQDGGNDWFYCDPTTGLMVTGWFQDGGNDWFYCDVVTGAMKTGWFQDGGSTWYYCFTQEDANQRGNRAGVMAANQWVLSNGNWYYLEESGAMATNKWVKDADDALLSWVGETGAFLYTE